MTKVTTTIELTERDREHIKTIQRETGETTLIGVIRMSLRKLAKEMAFSMPPGWSPIDEGMDK